MRVAARYRTGAGEDKGLVGNTIVEIGDGTPAKFNGAAGHGCALPASLPRSSPSGKCLTAHTMRRSLLKLIIG